MRLARLRQASPSAPRLRRDRVYVSFIISDGDNLPVLTANNFPQLWKDRLRGRFPIGWSISPSALMLIPDIADHYYSTATPNDDFLGAVSGIGYTYPDSYADRFRAPDRARIFDGFLGQTRDYMGRMGLRSLWIMNATRPVVIRRYAERIPKLQALFPDYGRRVSGYEDATYPTARNVPVLHALTSWQEGIPREQQIASLVTQIRSLTPSDRPAFMHLFVLNWFADLPMLREVLRRLGPGYVAVRPDHLAALYREELARSRVLVRAPSVIEAIEGRSLDFTAAVQDVASGPLEVRARVAGGLEGARVRPEQVRLRPGGSADMEITGSPAGGTIRLEARGAFGARSRRIEVERILGSEILGALPEGISLRFVRRFEAEDLAHRSGGAVPDAAASGGQAWAARSRETDAGYLVFGPYVPLPRGRYLALFRLKRTGDGDGPVGTVDTCVGGGTPVTASREVRASDLPRDEYRSVPLVFDHPGGPVETRFLWPGGVSVAVDKVSVWRTAAR